MAEPGARAEAGGAGSLVWHLALLLCVSAGFESLFIHYGLSTLDEAWPLYAARRLQEGGTLYRDVFFVFPPGHLLAAWIGRALDPPGIVGARLVYAAFQVAACLGVYLLGRRVMPPAWALLGGLLVAVGAPGTHLAQMLFGYRYLALAMLALLAFGRRLDTGSPRWTCVAGVATGACLVFRVSPAAAAAAAIGVGILASGSGPRVWLRDLGAFTLGVCLVALPALAVLWVQAGAEALYRELLVRPLAMTARQELPLPAVALPETWTRRAIRDAFVAVQYRCYLLLYAAYLVGLSLRLTGALRRGERFEHAFLLTLVVWGAVYFARTLGRADEAHLYSALPPICLLVAHATSQLRRVRWPRPRRARRLLAAAVGGAVLALFGFLSGADALLGRAARGHYPLASTGGRILATNRFVGSDVDWAVQQIRDRTRPGETVLDLAVWPVLWVLSGRDGPGSRDLVMPGTFLDAAEEQAFVDRLERRPPALVVFSRVPFDLREERSVDRTAPRLVAWVRNRYQPVARHGQLSLWAPRASGP